MSEPGTNGGNPVVGAVAVARAGDAGGVGCDAGGVGEACGEGGDG